MQIKQRLRLNSILSVVSVLFLLAVLVTTIARVNKAIDASRIADALITAKFERLALRTDYLRTGGERAREQVSAKYRQISNLLKSADRAFTDPENRKILDALHESHESIGKNFRAIVANREKTGAHGRPSALSQEIENRLLSQLDMRVYETVLLAGKLQESSNDYLLNSIKIAIGWIAFVFLLVGAVTLLNSSALRRTITARITRLRDGAAEIGAGNLQHKINITGNDEFAELSTAFNAMTEKLGNSYQELQSEIDLRKRAEEALLEAQSVLEQRIEERTKTLHELNESLEQRVLERTAELQAANETLRASRVAALNLMEDALQAHQQAEQAGVALRESELFYRQTLESIPGMIFTTRPDGYCDYQSQQWVDFTGVPMREHLGDGWNKLLHPDDRPRAFAAWQAAVEGLAPYDLEYRVRRHDGQYQWFKVIGRPIRDTAGQIVRWFGVAANIDAIKQGEDALQKTNQRLAIISEAAGDLLTAEEPQHLITELCQKVMQHLGCQVFFNFLADAETGRLRLNAYAGIPQDEAQKIEWLDYGVAVCGCAARDGARIVAECIQTTPDERTELVKSYGVNAYACHPLLGPGGKIIGTLSFGACNRDSFSKEDLALMKAITDRVATAMTRMQNEQALRLRSEQLQTVNKELESFIYSVSHDLRAPLRSVSGFTKIVSEDYAQALDEKGRDYLARIHKGAEKMSKLIDDLLHLSRISKQDLTRTQVDLSKMVAQAVVELQQGQPDRSVAVNIKQGLTASADQRLIAIALTNLLGNSWKFTSKAQDARIEFDAFEYGIPNAQFGMKHMAAVKPGETVYYVRDNGAGFDPTYASKMFLPFHRLHAESEFEGTGIGLTIVERVIRRHNGTIWAEGDIDKGATIFFTLG